MLGSGEPALEQRFAWLADVFREHVAVRIGFEVDLAHRIYAGSDLFAMPSRFEPCGLGQLYAMRYGAIPVVHAVGGLRDTVIDPGDAELARGRGTGIRFAPATPLSFALALDRAARLFRDPDAFATIRRAAMARDSSWTSRSSTSSSTDHERVTQLRRPGCRAVTWTPRRPRRLDAKTSTRRSSDSISAMQPAAERAR